MRGNPKRNQASISPTCSAYCPIYFRLLSSGHGWYQQQSSNVALLEKMWTKIFVEPLSRTELEQVGLRDKLCIVQVNLDMTNSMGPGKLVRHMQNPSYTYDEYLICIGLGPSISSVICNNPSYSGPSYPSSPVVNTKLKSSYKSSLSNR